VDESTTPRWVLENRRKTSLGCECFGSLLGTHPCNDTESNLVDHVGDVIQDGHDFSRNSIGNASGGVEQVADGVDDPADDDEPAQSVGAPHEFWSDLAVVNALSGGPWGTGGHDDHGPANTTEDEAEHALDSAGLAEVAESDHDDGTGETNAGESEVSRVDFNAFRRSPSGPPTVSHRCRFVERGFRETRPLR